MMTMVSVGPGTATASSGVNLFNFKIDSYISWFSARSLSAFHRLLVGLARFFYTMDALFSPLASAVGGSVDQIKVHAFQSCNSPIVTLSHGSFGVY